MKKFRLYFFVRLQPDEMPFGRKTSIIIIIIIIIITKEQD